MVYITRNRHKLVNTIQMLPAEFDSFVIDNNLLLFEDETGYIFTLYNGFCIIKLS